MPRDLEREVFGGSESELSSDEDEINRQQIRGPPKPKVVQPPREEAYESSAGDSEDDYQEQRAKPSKPKRPSAVRRRSLTDAKPAQRKRKRKEAIDYDLNELPPDQASKIRIDMAIEAALRPKKGSRQRKKKANEEVLDSFADAEVARLRETMNAAADEDQRANMEKLPATSKLKLLPEAMDTLQKASLAQSMIDNNLLEAVRRWLEPLPDRSLPALNIQREFFAILRKMEFIDGAVLKESGLGKVILFYTKCKRVTPDIARVARELVSAWSRPIIKRSASYRDKVVPTIADYAGGDGEGGAGSQAPGRGGEKLNAILARAKESEKHRVKRNAVSIPQRELGNYTVAPRSGAGLGLGLGMGSTSVDEDVERRKKNAERLRMLTRKAGGMK